MLRSPFVHLATKRLRYAAVCLNTLELKEEISFEDMELVEVKILYPCSVKYIPKIDDSNVTSIAYDSRAVSQIFSRVSRGIHYNSRRNSETGDNCAF